MKILFVCLGNICRSPLAEGIARDLVAKNKLDIIVDSCGTSGWHIDEAPDRRSIVVAKNHGIDISDLRGRQISPYVDLEWDYYIVMDESNKRDLLNMGFDENKIIKLGHFGADNRDVPDPYTYRDLEGFERVFNMIETCVKNLLSNKLKK
ncbi:protein tyrosine phosphatase [Helicobacter sp. 16-1353]|uniref:low molecular weight protein-tyrosine-phosphatase n=1 Tax=Helicobacter sp. 16-1353 TaxID=2004996 RepID=UPI000DCDA0AE|nr:low molecular weight protein-tyrosine-phosphatase [Helicobacter sp. 16-1353]RAX51503.1 protein tyrosine phosphatase [Helicobacter sp. 16-1353]